MFACMTTCNRHDEKSVFLTPGEAAAKTGLSTTWLAVLADQGKLTASRPAGTHRRYLRSEIEALVAPAKREAAK